jgi:hypothetical protein
MVNVWFDQKSLEPLSFTQVSTIRFILEPNTLSDIDVYGTLLLNSILDWINTYSRQ